MNFIAKILAWEVSKYQNINPQVEVNAMLIGWGPHADGTYNGNSVPFFYATKWPF